MSTIANSSDGLRRMVQNPKRYFSDARARATAEVDRELKRDRRQAHSRWSWFKRSPTKPTDQN